MNQRKFLRILYKIKHKKPGNVCPYCKTIRKTRVNIKYKRIYFNICNHYVSVLKNTPLYKTRIDIQNWIFFLKAFDSSHGISSTTAGKILGVTARQGYNCIKKIRQLIKIKRIKKCKNVQIDELFLGSTKQNSHKQKFFNEEYKKINKGKWRKKRRETWEYKSVVCGLAGSNGQYILINSGIKVGKATDLNKDDKVRKKCLNLWNTILSKYVDKNQVIYHDGDLQINKLLNNRHFKHDKVVHGNNEYVKGNKGKIVTTNAVEGLFGRFKRSFKGTHTFAKNHLQLYLNDWSFKNTYKFKSLSKFMKIIFM